MWCANGRANLVLRADRRIFAETAEVLYECRSRVKFFSDNSQ